MSQSTVIGAETTRRARFPYFIPQHKLYPIESENSRAQFTCSRQADKNMAAISCLYFGSLPFYKDWINVRLRLCYCCSALCLTLIQSWGTLVVTGKDDNCSGFSNAKFAIMSACRLSCLVTRQRGVTHENQNAIPSLRPDRYCVSLIDPDQSRNTGKYYDS